MFAENFILQSSINNLQAVKGLRFSPRLVYSLWLRCYCLPWYFLPQFPFLPILLPSFSFPRPPQEKCAWFLLCDTALFVRQRLSYWIISQSKSSAREARRGRTLEGRFRPHPILASFRHQKYTKTGWLHGGMTKGWSPSFILKKFLFQRLNDYRVGRRRYLSESWCQIFEDDTGRGVTHWHTHDSWS